MNVRELKDILAVANDDDDVVINGLIVGGVIVSHADHAVELVPE